MEEIQKMSSSREEKAESKWEGKEGDDDKKACPEEEFVLPGMGGEEEQTLLARAARFYNSSEYTDVC